MLYGINNNGDNLLSRQLMGSDDISKVVTNPIEGMSPFNKIDNSAYLIDESAISRDAYYLYQRECDVNNFTKLSMSNPEDTSHNELMQNLFSKGVIDPFAGDNVDTLVTNEKFLSDLKL